MMKHFKINVGRKNLSSDYIRSKQNFETVLKGVKLSKSSMWKSTWFYGSIGLAGLATIMGYKFYNSENHLNETIITQGTVHKEDIKEFDFLPIKPLASEVTMACGYSEKMEEDVRESINKNTASNTPVVSTKEKTGEQLPAVSQTEVEVNESKKETTQKVKPMVRSSMPSISGVYNGDISWETFKEGVVFLGEDLIVKQFSIQYTTRIGDKTISVQGDKIPLDVVAELENLGLNQTVFITNVVGKSLDGELLRFVSMDLNLKFK